MAASVQTNSTSLEGQLWELAVKAQLAELAVPEETRPNNVTTTVDIDAGTIAVTFTTPATFSVNADGSLKVIPTPYL